MMPGRHGRFRQAGLQHSKNLSARTERSSIKALLLLRWLPAGVQGVRMPAAHELEPLEVRFPKFDLPLLQFLKARGGSLRRPCSVLNVCWYVH